MAEESMSAKNSSNYNNVPNQAYYNTIKYVDAMTGENVDINSITDSIRLARAGSNIRDIPGKLDTIVHKEAMSNDLLAKFVTKPATKYSPADTVSCLGLYITDYIVDRITSLGDKNKDLAKHSTQFVEDMVFRDYIKGGTADFKNVLGNSDYSTDDDQAYIDAEGNPTLDKKVRRFAADMGVGVGEARVLNPTWQFNKRDDPRTNPMYTKIGRVYSTRLMQNWPVALIQPGRFKYNTSFFKLMGLGMGSGIQESLIRSGGEGINGAFLKFITAPLDAITVIGSIGSAIFGGNKVLEFKQTYNMFNQYTRFLLTTLASMMGLIEGSKYVGSCKDLNLHSILPTLGLGDNLTKYKNSQYLPFRCGKAITANESFNNSTTSNPLEEQMNSTAEENDPSKGDSGSVQQATKLNIMGGLTSFAKKAGLNLLGNFSEQALVLSGRGRVSLPEIFSSSSFSRSFSFDFKFHSPYGDNLSIFENCYIPFMILLALSVPRQIGKMTYTSPFAVRISVKNKVMINYGMVESLTVTRGGDTNDWTPSGFPKTVTCSLQVKDLEPTISLPLASRGPLRSAVETMFPSSGISEYLSSVGGLTLDDIEVFFNKRRFNRTAQMFTSTWNAKLNWDSLMSTVVNSGPINNIISLFAGTDLDNVTNILGTTTDLIKNSFNNNVRFNTGMSEFYRASVEMNGQGGFNPMRADNLADNEALKEMNEKMTESYYNFGTNNNNNSFNINLPNI